MAKVKANGIEYHIDGYVKAILDQAKKMVRKDWDVVFVVDGLEGAGKSRFALQIAAYLSQPLEDEPQVEDYFTLDDVVFKPHAFLKRAKSKEKYRAVVFDEAFRGLSNKRSMTWINHQINRMFNEIRQSNLYLIIVIPSFFELDRYPALHRSLGLFHVTADAVGNRGIVKFYDRNKKKELWQKGRWEMTYKFTKPNFFCRFTNALPLDQEAYSQKKYEALKDDDSIKDKRMVKFTDRFLALYRLLYEDQKMPQKEIAKHLEMKPNSLQKWVNSLQLKSMKAFKDEED